MKKIKLLIWTAVPIMAAVALVGLSSFTDDDEGEGGAPSGKVLSGNVPCTGLVCRHPNGMGPDGPVYTNYTITGAQKKECTAGQPTDNCRPRHEEACSGGTCSSGYGLPH